MDTKGIKTTEFWLSFAAVVLGAVISSGILGDDTAAAKVAGAIAAALAAFGYSTSRAAIKNKRVELEMKKLQAPATPEQPTNT